MTSGVYSITHSKSGKKYTGSSFNCEKRFKIHLGKLFNHKHHTKKLQDIYNTDGKESLIFSIEEEYHGDDPQELLDLENKWLDKLRVKDRGLNTPYGETGGKRKGAGRKASNVKTKVIRVPVVLIPEIEKMKRGMAPRK